MADPGPGTMDVGARVIQREGVIVREGDAEGRGNRVEHGRHPEEIGVISDQQEPASVADKALEGPDRRVIVGACRGLDDDDVCRNEIPLAHGGLQDAHRVVRLDPAAPQRVVVERALSMPVAIERPVGRLPDAVTLVDENPPRSARTRVVEAPPESCARAQSESRRDEERGAPEAPYRRFRREPPAGRQRERQHREEDQGRLAQPRLGEPFASCRAGDKKTEGSPPGGPQRDFPQPSRAPLRPQRENNAQERGEGRHLPGEGDGSRSGVCIEHERPILIGTGPQTRESQQRRRDVRRCRDDMGTAEKRRHRDRQRRAQPRDDGDTRDPISGPLPGAGEQESGSEDRGHTESSPRGGDGMPLDEAPCAREQQRPQSSDHVPSLTVSSRSRKATFPGQAVVSFSSTRSVRKSGSPRTISRPAEVPSSGASTTMSWPNALK